MIHQSVASELRQSAGPVEDARLTLADFIGQCLLRQGASIQRLHYRTLQRRQGQDGTGWFGHQEFRRELAAIKAFLGEFGGTLREEVCPPSLQMLPQPESGHTVQIRRLLRRR